MPIVRAIHDKDHPYTMLTNKFFSGQKMSLQAGMVAVYLLSKPDDWVIRIEDIANMFTNGSSSVRSAFDELKRLGHISSKAVRGSQRLEGWKITFYEDPAVNPDHNQQPAQTVETVEKSVQTLDCRKQGIQRDSNPEKVQSTQCEILKTTPLLSNDTLLNNKKNQVTMSEKSDSSLVPEETGFNFTERKEPEKKSAPRMFAEKLHSSLSVKRKIFRRDTDLKSWTKEIAKFIAESDVSVEEFEKVLDWYCDHIGEEYVPQAYSAESFVKKFPSICQQSQVFVVNRITSPVEILKEKWRKEYAAQQAANS